MHRTIGIDVSQDFLDVASYDGFTSQVIHYDTHNKTTFFKIIKDFSIDKETLVVMEATGVYHLKLADYFYQYGYHVAVVNPLKTKRFGEMKFSRVKTDKTDAKLIAQYGYEQKPKRYQPLPAERTELILILKGIEDLTEMKLQLFNRLRCLEKQVSEPQAAKRALLNIQKTLEKELKILQKKGQTLAQSIAEQDYQRLLDIPGVGPGIAMMIIGYYGNFSDFETANQAVAFAGLNPNPRESGTSVRLQGRISKKGHAYLRKMLYMGAVMAKQRNLMCQQLYQRLVEKGKPKKVALVAVANKLLRQIFAIVKYQRTFEQNYSQKMIENA